RLRGCASAASGNGRPRGRRRPGSCVSGGGRQSNAGCGRGRAGTASASHARAQDRAARGSPRDLTRRAREKPPKPWARPYARRTRASRGGRTSPTPVDADRLAGDEGGLVRGEIGDNRGDLVRAAEAADRDRLGALAEAGFQIVAI